MVLYRLDFVICFSHRVSCYFLRCAAGGDAFPRVIFCLLRIIRRLELSRGGGGNGAGHLVCTWVPEICEHVMCFLRLFCNGACLSLVIFFYIRNILGIIFYRFIFIFRNILCLLRINLYSEMIRFLFFLWPISSRLCIDIFFSLSLILLIVEIMFSCFS